MKQVEFHVDGDASTARATVAEALAARKFKLEWSDEWSGVARKGSVVANVLLGALAQHFKFGVAVMTAPEGHGVIRLDKVTSGWMGGAIGARRTTKSFEALKGELEQTFTAAGVLRKVETA
jgi:hypothetical protein